MSRSKTSRLIGITSIIIITWSMIAIHFYISTRYEVDQIGMDYRIHDNDCWEPDLDSCVTDSKDDAYVMCNLLSNNPGVNCWIENHCLEWKEVCPNCNQFIVNPVDCVMDWAIRHCASGICTMNYVNLTSCTDYKPAQNCECYKVCANRPSISVCNVKHTPKECVNIMRWPTYRAIQLEIPIDSHWHNTTNTKKCDYEDYDCITSFIESYPYNEIAYHFYEPETHKIRDLTEKQYYQVINDFKNMVTIAIGLCIIIVKLSI